MLSDAWPCNPVRGEARRWLSEAVWDLETARILHESGRYNAASFYCHQAAEKAAKAMLYSVNEAPWGYSVRVLLERYSRASGQPLSSDLLAAARELDRHYIPSRYPNAHPQGTPHESYDAETSERALEATSKILEVARRAVEGGG